MARGSIENVGATILDLRTRPRPVEIYSQKDDLQVEWGYDDPETGEFMLHREDDLPASVSEHWKHNYNFSWWRFGKKVRFHGPSHIHAYRKGRWGAELSCEWEPEEITNGILLPSMVRYLLDGQVEENVFEARNPDNPDMKARVSVIKASSEGALMRSTTIREGGIQRFLGGVPEWTRPYIPNNLIDRLDIEGFEYKQVLKDLRDVCETW